MKYTFFVSLDFIVALDPYMHIKHVGIACAVSIYGLGADIFHNPVRT